MKVLLKVCPRCGHLEFFSIEVLASPESDEAIGPRCTSCLRRLEHAGHPTEIDIPEITPPPHVGDDALTCEPAGD